MADFAPLESSNLISRKILNDEKSLKFAHCDLQTIKKTVLPTFDFIFSVLSVGLLLYFILVPESPRWDLNNHKIDRAKKTFLHIAKRNGIDVKQTNFEKYFSILRDRLEKEEKQLT